MKAKISAIFIITGLLIFTNVKGSFADNVRDYGYAISGLGITGEFTKTDNCIDGGMYLSYKMGLHHMLSAFFNFDIGYRLSEGSINGKIGITPMFFIFGINFGFAYAYRARDKDPFDESRNWGPFSPGGYISFESLIPHKQFPVFISIGGIFYTKSHDNEFFISATLLYNFYKK